MSFFEVKPVKPMQIVFDDDEDDDEMYIEKLSIAIYTLEKQLEELKQKWLKTENLRLFCLHNFLRLRLNDKLREFDTVFLT